MILHTSHSVTRNLSAMQASAWIRKTSFIIYHTTFLKCLIMVFVLGLVSAACTDQDSTIRIQASSETYGERLGTVQLEASCTEAATSRLAEGLALIHHMAYEGAEEAFIAATETDPECALGYWGQALSFIHNPVWADPPDEETFERAAALLTEAKTRGERSEREEAWIDAVESYYAGGWSKNQRQNQMIFAETWKNVSEQFPDDPEAKAFHALTHLSKADPNDKSYAVPLEAGALAEAVLEMVPDHPGAHHYIIHAYEFPPLANRALEAARNYGTIAPAVPHTLHMPGHIFTPLGLWEESIDWNRRSADAAIAHSEDKHSSMHQLHALDYLAYAYLQRGEDQKATDVAKEVAGVGPDLLSNLGTIHALTAVPARLALERRKWDEAAALEPHVPAGLSWDNFAYIEAITWFAKALGSAHIDNREAARSAIERLEVLREQTSDEYWKQQVEIQRLAATAWLQHAEGAQEEALSTMHLAVELEASTETHPVTPGEVLPAHELLGDLLLDMNQYEKALDAYDVALEHNTNRFNSLHGAGRAAVRSGDNETAASYFQKLLDITEGADVDREQLAEARQFLDDHQ